MQDQQSATKHTFNDHRIDIRLAAVADIPVQCRKRNLNQSVVDRLRKIRVGVRIQEGIQHVMLLSVRQVDKEQDKEREQKRSSI